MPIATQIQQVSNKVIAVQIWKDVGAVLCLSRVWGSGKPCYKDKQPVSPRQGII